MKRKGTPGVIRTLMSGSGYFRFTLKERLSLVKRVLARRVQDEQGEEQGAASGRESETVKT